MGFAPHFGLDESDYEQNFMYNLKQKGYIDHLIVSFIASPVHAQSLIKFGSIATEAQEGEVTMLKTVDDESWTLQSTEATLKGIPIF